MHKEQRTGFQKNFISAKYNYLPGASEHFFNYQENDNIRAARLNFKMIKNNLMEIKRVFNRQKWDQRVDAFIKNVSNFSKDFNK